MRVAIAGYGVEGAVNCKYWLDQGAEVVVFDQKTEPDSTLPAGIELRSGENVFSEMDGFDLVVRTASLNPKLIKTDGKVWSATNEFFAQCPAPIIGVTGTKGKGTTCTLIAKILKNTGRTVHLVGNIGVPALEVLPDIQADDIVVFELSSFQLWDIEQSPETAVLLMIEQDHMNVHEGMDDYVMAKANIGRFQTEDNLLVLHPTNPLTAKAATVSPAHKKHYMTSEGATIVDDKVKIDGTDICSVSDVGLLGAHNLENICAAITAAWRYTQSVAAIAEAVRDFKGLEHRLEFVRELDGVRYYNDSFSTGPGATRAAINSFSEPLVLIVGGSDKGAGMAPLIDALDSQKHRVILIGSSADALEQQCKEHGFEAVVNAGSATTMADIVAVAQSHAQVGDVVLLSPAHASFDMFKNVYDRGTQFKAEVSKL